MFGCQPAPSDPNAVRVRQFRSERPRRGLGNHGTVDGGAVAVVPPGRFEIGLFRNDDPIADVVQLGEIDLLPHVLCHLFRSVDLLVGLHPWWRSLSLATVLNVDASFIRIFILASMATESTDRLSLDAFSSWMSKTVLNLDAIEWTLKSIILEEINLLKTKKNKKRIWIKYNKVPGRLRRPADHLLLGLVGVLVVVHAVMCHLGESFPGFQESFSHLRYFLVYQRFHAVHFYISILKTTYHQLLLIKNLQHYFTKLM